jgi:periplasmic protein TonB
MRDRVADVLAQRATLDRGAGTAIATSVLLHGGLTALAVWAAMHATAPTPAGMVNIKLMPISQPAAPVTKARSKPAPVVEAPAVEKPKPEIKEPKITEPKPAPVQPPKKPPEKNTVPLSPFGRSTKKGSESPAVEPPKTTPAAPAGGTLAPGPEIAVGGTGVTGIEGGDFPYSLYIGAMQRKIGPNWFRPPSAATGTAVVVYFRILRDGRVTDARIETSSGNPTFDRLALSAVQSSNPFNPLPYGYEGTYLGIRLTFK